MRPNEAMGAWWGPMAIHLRARLYKGSFRDMTKHGFFYRTTFIETITHFLMKDTRRITGQVTVQVFIQETVEDGRKIQDEETNGLLP